MANVWTYWKCTSCGSIIRGDCRECPNCGTPIPAGVRYLMPDDPEVAEAVANGTVLTKERETVTEAITEVTREEEREKPNWVCDYCGFQNRYEVLLCEGCGARKEEATQDYFGNDLQPKPPQEEPKPEPMYQAPQRPEIHPPVQQTYTPRNQSGGCGKRLAVVAVFLAVIGFLIWLFIPVTRSSTIQGFEWERSIAVEEYQCCHESDWSLPQGAELTSQRQEIHHCNQVLDHYEKKSRQVAEQVLDGYDRSYRDLGNGQAEVVETPRYRTEYRTEYYDEPVYRQVPEYRTKYYYDIGRWKQISSLDTAGSDHAPYWHSDEGRIPASVANPAYGDKRQGGRKEKYYVSILDTKKRQQKVEYSYSDWMNAQIGDKIGYKTFRFSQKPL